MPEYLAPGVFIEEIERGPKPIEGVATSTAAFLGETARGTLKPRLITSYADYLRYFGDILDGGMYMPYAVKAFFDNGGRRCYIARIIHKANATKAQIAIGNFTFRAVGPGLAGNRTRVRLNGSSETDKDGNSTGFRVQAYYWDRLAPGDLFDPELPANTSRLPRPSRIEDFDNLSADPDSANYYRKLINNFEVNIIRDGSSGLIEINVPDGEPAPPRTDNGQEANLTAGTPGDPVVQADYQGVHVDPKQRTGLAALELDAYRDVAIIHAPNQLDAVVSDLITHCERNRFRFAVIDCNQRRVDATADPRRTSHDSKYAAYYYPWVTISDPRTGARKDLPPGGFVCGIYARSDNTRGVWKAPANEIVNGAVDLEFDINEGVQETLIPRGINVIRRFPGRGIRVWGARTISSDPLWKYVNVRRLSIFIEASIDRGTQWVVFEPNDRQLWAGIERTVTPFLLTQWREGALFGAKEEEAFSVVVGRETMTVDDILNGRLIIEIGIAPVRPAEFVIFRVFQKTQEANSGSIKQGRYNHAP